ncbi:MAG: ABC transporter permease [Bacteroidetes bacterium]|nr:ABC transporter permease [Bacteroidota bacterium]MBK8144262.1 ABC transporter permease [Bacteroidota bacterium]MBP6314210.1 ABC transporter permease [Chitinophagaceae bacterium]
MIKPLIIDIAKSLLLARWRQTLVAAVGVTFGITMFITLLGFMNGLNDLLDGLILNRTAHIRLFNEIKPSTIQPIDLALRNDIHFINSIKPNGHGQEIDNNLAIIASLKKDSRVMGVTPKVTAQVFYNVGKVDITGVINGIDVEAENKLFHFQEYVSHGNYIDLKNIPNSIILGKAAADKMLANIGDMIQVTSPNGERQTLKVVGFFQSGLQELDKVQSYASLATTQKILGKSNSFITDIGVKLFDISKAPAMAKEFLKIYETDAEDIQTANAQFETGSNVRSIISYAVGVTLLIVAGFGIYNILNMMIYEKMDSIAILKATGFSGQDVKRIFITIALSIGLFGGLLGLVFGFLTSLAVDQIPFNTAALPTIKTFPVNYNPKFYIIGITFSLITTYFAGWLPARKASQIDPVDIIRGK